MRTLDRRTERRTQELERDANAGRTQETGDTGSEWHSMASQALSDDPAQDAQLDRRTREFLARDARDEQAARQARNSA